MGFQMPTELELLTMQRISPNNSCPSSLARLQEIFHLKCQPNILGKINFLIYNIYSITAPKVNGQTHQAPANNIQNHSRIATPTQQVSLNSTKYFALILIIPMKSRVNHQCIFTPSPHTQLNLQCTTLNPQYIEPHQDLPNQNANQCLQFFPHSNLSQE